MRVTDSKEFQQKVLSAAQAYGQEAVDQALKVMHNPNFVGQKATGQIVLINVSQLQLGHGNDEKGQRHVRFIQCREIPRFQSSENEHDCGQTEWWGSADLQSGQITQRRRPTFDS